MGSVTSGQRQPSKDNSRQLIYPRGKKVGRERGGDKGRCIIQHGRSPQGWGHRVQELCESRGGRPGLSAVLMSLTVSVEVKQHCTALQHWSQFVPNMSTDIRGHGALHHHRLRGQWHTPSIAFRHLPPNSARFGYATEGALFISAQLSSDAVSALRKVWVQIRLLKQPSAVSRFGLAVRR